VMFCSWYHCFGGTCCLHLLYCQWWRWQFLTNSGFCLPSDKSSHPQSSNLAF